MKLKSKNKSRGVHDKLLCIGSGKKLFLFSILFFALLLSCEHSNEGGKPNVVLIVIDDLGWKDLGFMGSSYYETPNLDALAKESKVFMNAYASASNCAPSRACMLTGLATTDHGIYTVSPSDRGNKKTRKLVPVVNTKHIGNDRFTMHDFFKREGYVTGSFGKWHIGEDPKEHGVDVNVGGSGRGNPGKDGYFSPYNIDHIKDGPDGEYLTDRLTSEAIHFVEEYSKEAFFLYLPYYSVHTPISAKKELKEKFEKKKAVTGQSNSSYASMIYSVDENIGRIIKSIKNENIQENTIIIITSDNGGIRAISNQSPLRGGKGSYYEGGIRVPLLIHWADHIKAGKNYERVTNLDFFPTLESIIGQTRSEIDFAGIDISNLMFDNQKGIDERNLFWHFPIYLEAYDPKLDDGRDPLFRTRPGSVMISGNYKVHKYYEDGTMELYDLEKDPGERNNIAQAEKEVLKNLEEDLNKWLEENQAPIPKEKNLDYDPVFEFELIQQLVGKEVHHLD